MKKDEALKEVLERIGSSYEYVKPIGKGAFSKVYLIRHKLIRENRALKIMSYDTEGNPEESEAVKDKFIREAQLIEKISHPNIVKIHDIALVKSERTGNREIPYTVMSVTEGKTLREEMTGAVPMEMKRVKAICSDILAALTALHNAGIIHGDIKPDNIMIEKTSGKAVLIDFGFARRLSDEPEKTALDKSSGTPDYMAPEQFREHGKVNPQADIYSAGVVLYELLTGDTPYKGDLGAIIHGHMTSPIPHVIEKNPSLPPGMQTIIEKAMAKEPSKRYQTAEEMWASLKSEIEKGEEKEEEKEEKEKTPVKKKKSFIFYLSLFGILAAAVLAIYFAFFHGTPGTGDMSFQDALRFAQRNMIAGDLPKAEFYLGYAEGIKQTNETGELRKQLDDKKREVMKNDFSKLELEPETLPVGQADRDKKLADCRRFLEKHKKTPHNEETVSMIDQVNRYIGQLEKENTQDREYAGHIAGAERFIKNVQFRQAEDSVDSAEKIKKTQETRELKEKIRTLVGLVSSAEDNYKTANYRAAKEALTRAKEIEPGIELTELEKKIEMLPLMPGDVKDVLRKSKIKETAISKNAQGFWQADFGSGVVLAYIPAGKFKLGEAGVTAQLPAYWMGKTEVTIKQYKEFVNDKGWNFPEWLKIGSKFNIRTGDDDYYRGFVEDDSLPVVGIDWNDAKAYCRWLSRKTGLDFRLPDENRWEKAARGTDGRIYPWGNKPPTDNLCHYFTPGGPSKRVNSYPAGASPYGLLNMAGNVEEWCLSARDNNRPAVRGGSFYENENYIKTTSRKEYRPDERTHALGFRLCLVH